MIAKRELKGSLFTCSFSVTGRPGKLLRPVLTWCVRSTFDDHLSVFRIACGVLPAFPMRRPMAFGVYDARGRGAAVLAPIARPNPAGRAP